jgi:succinate dehydrogenase hydrophobic anchor subunit
MAKQRNVGKTKSGNQRWMGRRINALLTAVLSLFLFRKDSPLLS